MVITETILELDIEHAAPSIWYELGKIDKEEYLRMINLDKRKRVVQTGLKIKDNPELHSALQEGYDKYSKLLLESNKIPESNVFTRSHDAVWLINTIPEITEFGEVRYMIKSSYDMVFIYKKRHFFIESHTNKLKTRHVSKTNEPNQNDLLEIIRNVMISYSYGDLDYCYEVLHRAKIELSKNPLRYGADLLNNATNLHLIKYMIKTFT